MLLATFGLLANPLHWICFWVPTISGRFFSLRAYVVSEVSFLCQHLASNACLVCDQQNLVIPIIVMLNEYIVDLRGYQDIEDITYILGTVYVYVILSPLFHK